MSKSTKIWLSRSIFSVKIYWNRSDFFFIEEYKIRGTFITLFCKMIPNFDRSPQLQFSKFYNFLWVCWFLTKNLSDFVSLSWKLHNRYDHKFINWPLGVLLDWPNNVSRAPNNYEQNLHCHTDEQGFEYRTNFSLQAIIVQ